VSALNNLQNKNRFGQITELELCVLMAGTLCDPNKAAEQLATLETNCSTAIQANIEVAQLNVALQEKLDGYQTLIDHHKEHHAEYEKIKSHIESIEANYDALQTPMPCGHLARYAVNGEGGTQYCCMCLANETQKENGVLRRYIAKLEEEIDEQ